jgi:glutathione S-transferase
MLTIWGNADSINVQKVLWCCEEVGVAYERIDAGRHYGVINTPEFRARNPNGLVPTIDDDGFVVWESNAILRYLAAKHASGSLWPTDARARADADRWLDWTNSTLWPAMLPLFRAYMRTPADQRDAQAIEAARQATIKALQILDAQLATHAYVGGESFTMGDIAVGCAAWRWLALPVERLPLVHLQRWLDVLATRPAYRKVVMLPLS